MKNYNYMKKTYSNSDYSYYTYDDIANVSDDSFYANNIEIHTPQSYKHDPKSLLNQLDIKDIEKYLREKKLEKLKK